VAERDPAILHKAQALDLMAQRLDGLSTFVAGLAQITPSANLVDPSAAAEHVLLSDLAYRLTCPAAPVLEPAPAGDMELFD
jgi:hypothetical protein